MSFTITIPTKSRPEGLLLWFGRHYDPDYHYCVTIEEQEWKMYELVRKTFFRNVKYLRIKNNRGLCYARNQLCKYANDFFDQRFVLMSDDNAQFDIEKVPEFMGVMKRNKHIIWLGGFFTCRGLYDKALIEKAVDGLYQPNCVGTVYILRLSYWFHEQFDENIFYAEDDEYWLRIRRIFYPYNGAYVYIPFEIKKKRHAKGGHEIWKTNEKRVRDDVDYINRKLGVNIMGVRETKTPGIFMYWAKWKKYDEYLAKQKFDHLEERGSDEQIQLEMDRDKEN